MNSPAPAGSPFSQWLNSLVPAVYPNWAALADAIGTSRANVTYWRQGAKTPSVPMLLKISNATGMSIEKLIKLAGYAPEGDPR